MIAGEASGDLHGSGVVRELKKVQPDLQIYGVGGPRMREAGMQTAYDIRQMAVIGVAEVLRHLWFFRKVMAELKRWAVQNRPDLVLLIDYPGFNLRFSGWARRQGFPVLYYISPQIWAWGHGRIRKIASRVDHLAVIFPFEETLYRQAGIPATFVGHPLLEEVEVKKKPDDLLPTYGLRPKQPLLALFPGSRKQEVERILPDMVNIARTCQQQMPELQVAVSHSEQVPEEVLRRCMGGATFPLVTETYDLMAAATVLLVASGTATLEAAIVGTPFAVVYRVAPVTYFIGKRLVKIRHISLANIVAGKEVVPEFVQHQFRVENVAPVLLKFLKDEEARERVRKDLEAVRGRLGEPGAACKVAQLAIRMMGEKK